MSELLEKLGVDWKLLLAQALNFFAVLLILRFTVYKPLIKVLEERRKRIEKGMKDAEEAGKHLAKVEEIGKSKLAEAEKQAIAVIVRGEQEAGVKEAQLLAQARLKEWEIVKTAEKIAEVKKEEIQKKFFDEAAGIVRAAIAKTVNLNPAAVDDALIGQALSKLKKDK